MVPEEVEWEAQPVPWPKPCPGAHLALTGVLGLKNSWVTSVAYHETAVKVQRPKDRVGGVSALLWPPEGPPGWGYLPRSRGWRRSQALTRQEE